MIDKNNSDNFYSTTALKSNKQDWETPQKLFDKLNEKYTFTYDLAANKNNHKVNDYFDKQHNSLLVDWSKLYGNLFLNPPYSRELKIWIKKAYESSLRRNYGKIILLIPSRTDTSYWHDFIFGKAKIEFLRGRLKFELNGVPKQPAPFPSAIVVYEPKGQSSEY